MPDSRPIGIFDSGIGGLSVLREVRRLLPGEPILYFADQGHLPYGPRPRDEIRAFVVAIIQAMIDQGCKLIVIACNAACAAALHYARERFPEIPIVGMEPAIKPAAEHTRSGVIGIITTKATYQGELFASVIDRFAEGIKVEAQVCPKLVLLVEQGAPDTSESRAIIDEYLKPLLDAGIDQLVIGCTHFTFLEAQLRARLGNGIAIVDPAPAVARQVKRVLEQRNLLAKADLLVQPATVRYLTSGNTENLQKLIGILLDQRAIDVHRAVWDNGRLLLPNEIRT